MNNYDKPSNPDLKLDQDIASVKLSLEKLTPNLESVISREQQDSEPHVEMKNRSFFDIKVDQQAINAVLVACGFPQESLGEINIMFRSAQLADRNYWGQPAAGLRMDGEDSSQMIEIYTSVPHTTLVTEAGTQDALEKTKLVHYGFKKEQIVISLLEELRHAIQVKLNLFNLEGGSFEASDYQELRTIDYEKDAEEFTRKLKKYLLPFVEILKYSLEELQEMYVEGENGDVKDLFPQAIGSYLDKSLVAQVRETDPPGLYLSQGVDRVDVLNESEVRSLLQKIEQTLNSGKIGFSEARWLYQQLNNKLDEVGDQMMAKEVESKITEIS